MSHLARIATLALALPPLMGAAASGALVSYDADCLERIVGELGYDFTPGVDWAAADTTVALDYRGRRVRIDVASGRVVHVGYRLFSAEQRQAMPYTPLFNFLERYSLDADLRGKNKKPVAKMLAEDGITCSPAGFAKLPAVASNPAAAVAVAEMGGQRYRVEWQSPDAADSYFVELPIDYDLLHGVDMLERERRLLTDLQAWPAPADAPPAPLRSRKGMVAMFTKGYYILPGDSYLLDNLTTNAYYWRSIEADTLYVPIYDREYPMESLATLLLRPAAVAANFMLDVKVDCYGHAPVVRVPLAAALDYFRARGCTAYFGVSDYQEPTATCYLVLRNALEGFCHLLRVTADTSLLDARAGTLTARLTPYIPMARVAQLFAE